MNRKLAKLFALALSLLMVVGMFVGCQTAPTPAPVDEPEVTEPDAPEVEAEPEEEVFVYGPSVADLDGKEYGTDYISVWEQLKGKVTIDDVVEDTETGLAYVTVDGVEYELGMDFLSMANVYLCEVPEGSKYATSDDIYAAWWKLYMQRWNYLLPEMPLYSNEYYDVYNAEIGQVQENPTNPFWGPTNALIDWTSAKADNDIILGNSTELSGKFRYSNFGGNNPGASDLDVDELVNELGTVVTTKEGGYTWNETVVKEHKEEYDADGNKTFTITIHDDLLFSDGSPITAKNYLISALVFSSPVAAAAAGKDHMAGMRYVGYEDFAKYTGAADSEGTKFFSGFRLIDEYTFSATVKAEHLPYFYDITYGGFGPFYGELWLGAADIADDGEGAYLTDDFYAKNGDVYTLAAHITASSLNTDNKYPYSGPYCVESFDTADKSVVLVRNPYYKGNYEGTVPTIEKIIYKKIVSATQLEDLKSGGIDVITGITGGAETDEALKLCEEQADKFAAIHYSRAGYGKLGYRADFGPTQFVEVRQAIAYCVDRAQFAKDFTGGYGGVVDGPYYAGSWMYKAAMGQGMTLDAYANSVDTAIETLEAGGWKYDAEGNEYTEGIRYKKIPADKASEKDITFQSKDGAYKTTKVGDFYYMPLCLNWFGTEDNEFTDQLVTGFAENDKITQAGFYVQREIGTFQAMLDELYQMPVYGLYAGTPLYTCFNFATGFTSAAYDYSYNWTVDPGMYDDYSICYVKDLADICWLG